jgi:ribonuclease M5
MIKEVIVVEGKDDISAVKAAIDAELIATNGFRFKKDLIPTLKRLQERRGLIILTDPDYAGEQIRRRISKEIKGCKHAFLPQGKALKKGDIGIENAKKEDIIQAINKARPEKEEREDLYTKEDMINYGLSAGANSREKRDKLGHLLGIGYGNSKQFLNRLNSFKVSKEEFRKGLERIGENGKR